MVTDNTGTQRAVYEIENDEGLRFFSLVEPIPSRKEKELRMFFIPSDFIDWLLFDAEEPDLEILRQEAAHW